MKKRLIDANALENGISKMFRPYGDGTYPCDEDAIKLAETLIGVLELINEQPTVDAVEVVFCDECENHGNCYPETIFRLARIEKPFCCVGKRKTNTNCGAKMDGGS